MATPKQEIKRGDNWDVYFEYKQPNGDPVDLTGCIFHLQVRDKSDNLLIDVTEANGLTVDAVNGRVDCTVSGAVMRTLPCATHFYDLECTYPSGRVESSQTIQLIIKYDVTRPE
ncbi:hypothetical protein HUU62_08590 [Rhodoferax sp. 4810]|uniref:BppU N-terminal domain-containing protein n=1 Tax=Thiospirillum jenense TaxID=1653858 RepID=A0A839H7F6_9GAMM|nr:hypothetical protein [Thiospirillum jenense]MBB1074466.1 hypothetical protein [Rhodoferax jenense]MBB1125553.1 hypothetical protein [Thiospirillum jenense]